MAYGEQLSIFQFDSSSIPLSDVNVIEKNESVLVSENLKDGFNTLDVPFFGCDFETVYPKVSSILPKETITFDCFDTETAIRCELICAAICHQINWDFLRYTVFNKTKMHPKWLDFDNLINISAEEVFSLLQEYHKFENIKPEERSKILNLLGVWGSEHEKIIEVFIKPTGELRPFHQVYSSLLNCIVFASDPGGKKINLLLQKLDSIKPLKGLSNYAKPTIDYHLIRLYLRRGLVYARTKYAEHYINNQDAERRESTVAAIRELCAKLLCQISTYTAMGISSVNLVEWHVARSVCHRESPDCKLVGNKAQWLRQRFKTCPFYNTCLAHITGFHKLLTIKEPYYKGTSY